MLIFFLGLLAALCQAANGFLGWKFSRNELSDKWRRFADTAFAGIAILGCCVGAFATYLGTRLERVHFSFNPVYAHRDVEADGVTTVPYSWLTVDRPLTFALVTQNVGNGSAYDFDLKGRSYLEPDKTPASQKDAVKQFNEWLQSGSIPTVHLTLPKGEKGFTSADGVILSPEDIENIKHDRRTVFIVGRVVFKDDFGFGSHTNDYCAYFLPQLKPTASVPGSEGHLQVLEKCLEHNSER